MGLNVQRRSSPGQLTDDSGTFQQQVDGVRGQYGDAYQQDSEGQRQKTGQISRSTPVESLAGQMTNITITKVTNFNYQFLFLPISPQFLSLMVFWSDKEQNQTENWHHQRASISFNSYNNIFLIMKKPRPSFC